MKSKAEEEAEVVIKGTGSPSISELNAKLFFHLIILLGFGWAIKNSPDVPPRAVDINVEYLRYHYKPASFRYAASEYLLIYDDQSLRANSSCLGLDKFCSNSHKITYFGSPVRVKFLVTAVTSETPTFGGLILEIADRKTQKVLFKNDPDSIKTFLHYEKRNRYLDLSFYLVVLISFCYAVFYVTKILKLRRAFNQAK